MPHVSKNSLENKTEKELLKALKIVLTRIGKNEEMDLFLFSLLSKTEQIMLAKRLAIALLIKENVPESSIANSLHVTRGTVDRLKLFLEAKGDQGYNIAIKMLEQEKIHQEFKKFLFSLARYSIRAAGGRVKPTILD